MTAPSSSQFNFQLPSPVDSTVTAAGSTPLGNKLGNAVKATTGVTDFKQAGQDFSRGGISGIAGGIGHSIMGGINAASTAAMAVPGVGEGVKAADIGLNAAVKGADMFKAADAAKAADSAAQGRSTLFSLNGQNLKIVPKDTGLHNPVPLNVDKPPSLYHGSGNVIPAGKPITTGGPMSKDYAYATKGSSIASNYAKDRAARGVGTPEGQQALFGVVHKVEPSEGVPVFKDATPHGEHTKAYISKQFTSQGPTHLTDVTGVTTPLGNNSPITKKTILDDYKNPNFAWQEELPGFEDRTL
jgi:hypothetical protein